MAETVRVRGEGGVIWVMDVPPAGSQARERFDAKVAAGQLVPVDDDGVQVEAPVEPAKPAPEPAPEPAIPQRTIAEILDEVGDQADRASAALTAELATEDPRKTLVAKLEAIIASDDEG